MKNKKDNDLFEFFSLTIRQLYKIDSKLQAGQIIAAFRENRRAIASLERKKAEIKQTNSEE